MTERKKRVKKEVVEQVVEKALPNIPVVGRQGGWIPVIRESFTGAFQQNIDIPTNTVLAQSTIFKCMKLIASDISKLEACLKKRNEFNIWEYYENSSLTPLLKKPNHYQTRIQFFEQWIMSKLAYGNTFVLKRRDSRNVVNALYILDPTNVQIIVGKEGDIFYRVRADDLAGLQSDTYIPQREIIHDRWNTIQHPLVGLAPVYAAGLAALQSLNIQYDSSSFFGNQSIPSGILSTDASLTADTAQALQTAWDDNFSGNNAGKVAILGDGLKFNQMRISAVDAQMIEQLQWAGTEIASVFSIPLYKVGLGPLPSYNNIQALNVEYYSQTLQVLVEAIEVLLDQELPTPTGICVQFDINGLLRMDTQTQVQTVKDLVVSGIMSPNEARAKFDMNPVEGGEQPFIQQQNYTLEQAANRVLVSTEPTRQQPEQEVTEQEPTEEEVDLMVDELTSEENGYDN